jgi:hypothetical protein
MQDRRGREGTNQGDPMSGFKHPHSDQEMQASQVVQSIPGTLVFLAQAISLHETPPDPFVLDTTRPR